MSCKPERLCRTGLLEPAPITEDVFLFVLILFGGPDKDGREAPDILGLVRGGPIEGRLVALTRDFTLESEVLAVVVGVVVRGVEAAELVEDARGGFFGGMIGDCSGQLDIDNRG